MRKRVIVHIGMHKTGSTTIQASFSGYDRDRTVYADLGPWNHSIVFRTAFDPDPMAYGVHRMARRSEADVARRRSRNRQMIERQVRRDADVVIFSGEDISMMPPEGVQDMSAFLSRLGADVEIVGYARDPVTYAGSMLLEQLKGGIPLDRLPWPHYRHRFEKFLDTFGPEKVDIRAYDPKSFPDGDVVLDFAAAIGVQAPEKRPSRLNTRLSHEAANVLFAINRSGKLGGTPQDVFETRHAIIPLLSGFGETSFRITADQVGASDHPKDRQWLSETLGISFDLPRSTDKQEITSFFGPPDWPALKDHMARHLRKSPKSAEPEALIGTLVELGKRRVWQKKIAARVGQALSPVLPRRLAARLTT